MQQGLIQALMSVLPSQATSLPSSVMQGDGTVDFAAFLKSMAPALERQLEGMPAEVRAGLLAELNQEIRNAQAVAKVNSPEAKALDAMLTSSGAAASDGEVTSDDPQSLLDQLLGMLGEQATLTIQGEDASASAPGSVSALALEDGAQVDASAGQTAGAVTVAGWMTAVSPAVEMAGADRQSSASVTSVAASLVPVGMTQAEANGQASVQASMDAQAASERASAASLTVARQSVASRAEEAAAREAFVSATAVDGDIDTASLQQAAQKVLGSNERPAMEASRLAATLPQADDAAADGARDGVLQALAAGLVGKPGSSAAASAVSVTVRDVAQAVESASGLERADNEGPLAQVLSSSGETARVRQELPVLERIAVQPGLSREFGEAVGQRVMLMVGREMQGARIELNPVDLGPMEINLQLRGNEATIHFAAAHAMTREAIEAALPRLRDLLAEQGYTQVNVNVGQQQGQNPNAQAFGGQGQGGRSGQEGEAAHAQGGEEAQSAQVNHVEMRIRASGVDLFA
ncbi:MAG: flagellar hook-length control protein FliK [Pseudomonadota bacterium]